MQNCNFHGSVSFLFSKFLFLFAHSTYGNNRVTVSEIGKHHVGDPQTFIIHLKRFFRAFVQMCRHFILIKASCNSLNINFSSYRVRTTQNLTGMALTKEKTYFKCKEYQGKVTQKSTQNIPALQTMKGKETCSFSSTNVTFENLSVFNGIHRTAALLWKRLFNETVHLHLIPASRVS